jgi:predicted glycogen debranching enzyme
MPMGISFGREVCGRLDWAESREWLVTNGIGGYAAGTVAGVLTRCYHGLLIAALEPPLGRTLLVAKLDDTVSYGDRYYPLHTNRWGDGAIGMHGYRHLERFSVDGSIPVWRYACADALLEKRIWMQPGANTTYVQYQMLRGTLPLNLTLKALVNYRDHHSVTQGRDWQMTVVPLERGLCVSAFPTAQQLRLLSDRAQISLTHDWYYGFELTAEQERGLSDRDDHLHVATFQATLALGETLTLVLSSESHAELNGEVALKQRRLYDAKLLGQWKSSKPTAKDSLFETRLVLAADQFIVNRGSPTEANGKTILAGYPWFSDWGRDTMISLPGLTLATGRPEIARSILRVYAHYVDQGMIPNRFPDHGANGEPETPEYNTVDATLWYFSALRAYYKATEDDDLIQELFPTLAEIIDWHCRGTRFDIHLDPADGLLYAGEGLSQLTWMDAKVNDWVVTPRIGKPVEVNALWFNALRTIAMFARRIGKPHQEYEAIADRALARFSRFWHSELGYCYDVLDAPEGHDASLRPNQIFAVSLPESPLTPAQQKQVVEVCGRSLLTSHGLRSLAMDSPQYQGRYQGGPLQRDGAYHQGTVWGWLLGPFALAHLRVYNDPAKAREFLEPMVNQLYDYGIGTLGEIFDGDAPMTPRGCFAQAWTVAEVLRAWQETEG